MMGWYWVIDRSVEHQNYLHGPWKHPLKISQHRRFRLTGAKRREWGEYSIRPLWNTMNNHSIPPFPTFSTSKLFESCSSFILLNLNNFGHLGSSNFHGPGWTPMTQGLCRQERPSPSLLGILQTFGSGRCLDAEGQCDDTLQGPESKQLF